MQKASLLYQQAVCLVDAVETHGFITCHGSEGISSFFFCRGPSESSLVQFDVTI
ncbi:MAG: hypothetical protein ACK51L_03245 [bacterium]